jgi:DNA-binding transcriptional LysR family regulator
MDINKIKAFIAVCNTGSYSKVAKDLGYTHAGISYMVKSLEDEVGFALLEKKGTSRIPTAHAQKIIPELLNVLDAVDRLDRTIAMECSSMSAGLNIGAIESASAKWIPLAIARFTREHPDVPVNVFSGDPFQINKWLRDDAVDIALTVNGWSDPDFTWTHLLDDQFYGLLPRDDKNEVSIAIEDFEGKYIFVPSPYGNRSVTSLLDKHGISYKVPTDNTISTMSVNSNVAVGRGYSISTSLMIDSVRMFDSPEELQPKVLPIEPQEFREIGIARKNNSGRSHLADDFVHCLKQIIREYPIEGAE